jgi:hypothetical protein
MLDDEHRATVLSARDTYEAAFRDAIKLGIEDGEYRAGLDPKMASIFILSVLNALERWYQPDGGLDREALVGSIWEFVGEGLR